MSTRSPGIELVLELVRDAARARRCTACGAGLAAASIEPERVEPDRVAARLVCPCGAAEVVEVRPAAGGEGRAEIR